MSEEGDLGEEAVLEVRALGEAIMSNEGAEGAWEWQVF